MTIPNPETAREWALLVVKQWSMDEAFPEQAFGPELVDYIELGIQGALRQFGEALIRTHEAKSHPLATMYAGVVMGVLTGHDALRGHALEPHIVQKVVESLEQLVGALQRPGVPR